jgi:EAL domain-containing protein (putative c-di-GMP-specific phosphodiesterase class I)
MNALALDEGVEREVDLHFLKEMGYDLFQGYRQTITTPVRRMDEILANPLERLKAKKT